MNARIWIGGVGIAAMPAMTAPAQASAPTASCIGQQLSVYGPAYGAELGAGGLVRGADPVGIGHGESRRLDERGGAVATDRVPGRLTPSRSD